MPFQRAFVGADGDTELFKKSSNINGFRACRIANLFLFGRNGQVLVLAQGFLDLLLDLEQGGVQRGGLCGDFGEVGNMGGAAICRECAKHRIRLGLVRTFFESGMVQCQ